MTSTVTHVSARAAELRHAFDRAFAAPVRLDAKPTEDLLAIRVGGQPCALRLSEVAGLFAGKAVTRVPGSHPALRGLAGFRGALLPVYDLPLLLGHGAADRPRWLVIAAAAPVALAFEGFQAQLRIARDEILPHAGRADAQGPAREIVRTKDFVGPILHLPSLLSAIKMSKADAASVKE